MASAISNSYSLHLEFDDFDLLTEAVREWDLDFVQLDSGRFSGTIEQVRAGQVMIGQGRLGRMLRQQGGTPAGTRSFVLPADPDLRLHWRGRDVTGEDMLIYQPGGDFESISRPGFHMITLTVPEELLSHVATAAGLPEVDELLNGAEVATCGWPAMGTIRRTLSRIFREARNRPDFAGSPGLGYELEHEIPGQLLGLLARSRPGVKTPSPRRQRALNRAMALLEASPDEPVTVRDLCRAAGVSERTLQYAFREHVGVSPKAFLQARRLNGVRRMLRKVEPGTTVSDIANRWGFWHMGQFAADYRRLFDELPSETLSRGRT